MNMFMIMKTLRVLGAWAAGVAADAGGFSGMIPTLLAGMGGRWTSFLSRDTI
jgi:hypothetical protein